MARQKWAPTEDQRSYCRTMSAYGIPQDVIARLMKVSPKTLRKHCKEEIENAAPEYLGKIAESLTAIALGRRGNQVVTTAGVPVFADETKTIPIVHVDWNSARGACEFIMGRRGGEEWRLPVTQKIEHSGSIDNPSALPAVLILPDNHRWGPAPDDDGDELAPEPAEAG